MALLGVFISVVACQPSDPCADLSAVSTQRAPESYLGLAKSQQDAVVSVSGTVDGNPTRCSAVLVDRRHLLSAAHCDLIFRAGDGRAELGGERLRAQVQNHPELDLLVATLDQEAPAAVLAIGIVDRLLDEQDQGALAVTAGLGDDGRGGSDGQVFVVGRMTGLDTETIEVTDMAAAGPCEGDSGGPLLVRGQDGRVRIVGILHSSTLDCLSRASYQRLDLLADWLVAQGVEATMGPCGRLGEAGRCFGTRAIWCRGDDAQVQDCGGKSCGWSTAQQGWRCIDREEDVCAGVDERGHCRAARAIRCQAGQLVEQDCAACGLSCNRDTASFQVSCDG